MKNSLTNIHTHFKLWGLDHESGNKYVKECEPCERIPRTNILGTKNSYIFAMFFEATSFVGVAGLTDVRGCICVLLDCIHHHSPTHDFGCINKALMWSWDWCGVGVGSTNNSNAFCSRLRIILLVNWRPTAFCKTVSRNYLPQFAWSGSHFHIYQQNLTLLNIYIKK